MFTKKWAPAACWSLAAVAVASSLLIPTCTPKEVVKTVEVTVPPEEIIVEVTVEVPVEVPVEVEEERPLGAGCTYNAYRLGWVMDYADAENMLNVVWHPDSPFQYTFWDDETFRDLVDQALMETNVSDRMQLWQQAEDILVTDYVATIPILHYDRTALKKPEVEGGWPPFGLAHLMRWKLPEGQDTLRIQLGGEPPTLDVNLGIDSASYYVLNQLMESLYRYTDEGTIEPAGAESYEVSPDGTVYTVYLRQDATWSDGEPVTAQHYVDGITRLLDPATAAEYAWLMYVVQGAEAFNIGETDDPSTLGLRAVDDYTLEIKLEQVASYFDSILAFPTTYPVRLDVIEEYGDLWAEPGNFVGNGPYVLTEWAHEDHVTIDKNPSYHSAGEVTIERVEYPIIMEDATALAAYERGELDVVPHPPSEELPRILEGMPEHLIRLPLPGVYYMGLNLLRPPTDNLNMRKALASAVDKRAILDNVMEMPWRIEACGVIPPEIPGYQGCGSVGFEFDPAAAQGYLQDALAEMGLDEPGDVTINLWFNRGNEDVIEAVAEQWETNLGITVNVAIMEWGAYLETLDSCRD
jgi:oligopeptide transport system substrate-binding protein